jgi:hypothetical protein
VREGDNLSSSELSAVDFEDESGEPAGESSPRESGGLEWSEKSDEANETTRYEDLPCQGLKE